MSVERVVRKSGTVVWRARWRQDGRNRSRVLGLKRDAEIFDGEVRRRKRMGELALLDAGKQPLSEFGEEWWRLHAEPNLAASTLELYAMLWNTHILPRLGATALRELTPEAIGRFRTDLEAAGAGRVCVSKALTLLQCILQRACEWGRVQRNPARLVPKPSAARARSISPLAPETVEAIRSALVRRGFAGDATLVSVLAYAGLRPGEALGLKWPHVGERTILVERAVSLGAIGETKTRRRRTVRILAPLAHDLAAWRLRPKGTHATALVFPSRDGGPWT